MLALRRQWSVWQRLC